MRSVVVVDHLTKNQKKKIKKTPVNDFAYFFYSTAFAILLLYFLLCYRYFVSKTRPTLRCWLAAGLSFPSPSLSLI